MDGRELETEVEHLKQELKELKTLITVAFWEITGQFISFPQYGGVRTVVCGEWDFAHRHLRIANSLSLQNKDGELYKSIMNKMTGRTGH